MLTNESSAMAMSKEQRRKLHGIGEPFEPGDPRVMARRNLHEAVTKWDLRWATTIHFLSGAIAFGVVLLPTLLPQWRSVIESVRPLAVLHYELTRPSVWLFLPLAIALCLGFYSTSKRDYKKMSHHGYPINLGGAGSQEIIDMDLYPRTTIEEKVFFADFVSGIFMFGWWFGILGGFSIILKSGGN
jgi:hypothetical protein